MRIERHDNPTLIDERDQRLLDGMDLSVEMLEEIYECAAPKVELPCTIGPYRLHREVGRGSCGRVYQAIDTTLDHPVAVKLLADYANDLSEARKAVAVEHGNIVRVFAAGHHEGIAYIVYEFVDGPRLDQYLASRSERTRLRVVRDLARGVVACHDAGIVHGDIRPRNVLMDIDRPKLADFGLDTMGATMADDVADLHRLAGLSSKPPATAARCERILTNRLLRRRRLAVVLSAIVILSLSGWYVTDIREDARIAAQEKQASDQKLQGIGMFLSSTIKNLKEIRDADVEEAQELLREKADMHLTDDATVDDTPANETPADVEASDTTSN